MNDVNWFKSEFELYLKGYDVEYRFYEDGDFGALNQVEFNSKEKGGEIDFWSLGWIHVHFVNYVNGEELLNALFRPEQFKEQNEILNKLKELL